MPSLRWNGPLWLRTLSASAVVTAIIVILLAVDFVVLDAPVVRLPFEVLLLVLAVPVRDLAIYTSSKEVWRSVRTRVDVPITRAVPSLHRALAEAGIPFGVREGVGGQWEQVIETGHGALRIHLRAQRGRTELHPGPVDEGNRGEVERLKGLVDAALAL